MHTIEPLCKERVCCFYCFVVVVFKPAAVVVVFVLHTVCTFYKIQTNILQHKIYDMGGRQKKKSNRTRINRQKKNRININPQANLCKAGLFVLSA